MNMIMEPIILLTGLITIWAQLNNYGIDSEKNPHLKDVRVRREIDPQLHRPHNKIEDSESKMYIQQGDSLIIKSIYNGVAQKRHKRNYYNGNNYYTGYNYNGNHDYNVNKQQYGYQNTQRIQLANYPTNVSPTQIPYYYNNINNGSYNGYNGNINRNPNYTNNGNAFYVNHLPARSNITYLYNNNANNLTNYMNQRFNNNNIQNTTNNGTYLKFYDPFNNNQTVIPLYNGSNDTIANDKKNVTRKIVKPASFMSGINCPEFMHGVKLFGSNVCVDEEDY